jgi:hypothetical protein
MHNLSKSKELILRRFLNKTVIPRLRKVLFLKKQKVQTPLICVSYKGNVFVTGNIRPHEDILIKSGGIFVDLQHAKGPIGYMFSPFYAKYLKKADICMQSFSLTSKALKPFLPKANKPVDFIDLVSDDEEEKKSKSKKKKEIIDLISDDEEEKKKRKSKKKKEIIDLISDDEEEEKKKKSKSKSPVKPKNKPKSKSKSSDSEDDIPVAHYKKKKSPIKPKSKSKSPIKPSKSSDSEDDMPIAHYKKKKSPIKPKSPVKPKSKSKSSDKKNNVINIIRDEIVKGKDVIVPLPKPIANPVKDLAALTEDQVKLISPFFEEIKNYSRYKGSYTLSNGWLNFLERKYNNVCIMYNSVIDFYAISDTKRVPQINGERERLIVEKHRLLQAIKNCKKRFLIFNCTLHNLEGSGGHSNGIAIDIENKVLIQFEPHGPLRGKSKLDRMKNLFDSKMKKFVNEWKDEDGSKVLNKIETTRKFSFEFQRNEIDRNLDEKYKVSAKNGSGFCVAWSLMFLHYRIAFPHLTSKQVVAQMKKHPNSLAHKIRAYITYIMKHVPV